MNVSIYLGEWEQAGFRWLIMGKQVDGQGPGVPVEGSQEESCSCEERRASVRLGAWFRVGIGERKASQTSDLDAGASAAVSEASVGEWEMAVEERLLSAGWRSLRCIHREDS